MIPQHGQTHRKGQSINSIKRLRELYLGARISNDLFMLMQMGHSREKLRSALVETYFSPSTQDVIQAQSQLNYESDVYSSVLINTAEAIPECVPSKKHAGISDKVRNQGFRKAIVSLYNHRYALCGIKMRTPEGHTVVDAALSYLGVPASMITRPMAWPSVNYAFGRVMKV